MVCNWHLKGFPRLGVANARMVISELRTGIRASTSRLTTCNCNRSVQKKAKSQLTQVPPPYLAKEGRSVWRRDPY